MTQISLSDLDLLKSLVREWDTMGKELERSIQKDGSLIHLREQIKVYGWCADSLTSYIERIERDSCPTPGPDGDGRPLNHA